MERSGRADGGSWKACWLNSGQIIFMILVVDWVFMCCVCKFSSLVVIPPSVFPPVSFVLALFVIPVKYCYIHG